MMVSFTRLYRDAQSTGHISKFNGKPEFFFTEHLLQTLKYSGISIYRFQGDGENKR